MSRITINLDNTYTGSFAQNEFLHRDAKVKFLNIIQKNMNDTHNDKRVHNTILINGKRGYGKTSFMLSMINDLNEKYNDIVILKMIDPTIIETKENIFILVLSLIKKEVESCLHSYCNNVKQNDKKEFEDLLEQLASGLNVLDGIGGKTLFKDTIWNEPRLILDDALKNTKGGSDLECNFKLFLKYALKILNKKAFVLIFDDIDTASNQGEMILELIRKYFTSAKLFVVLLGDIELFNLIVRNMQWKKLNPTQIKDYECGLIDNFYKDEIDTLTEQYLIKILRNENVVYLKSLAEIHENIYIDNNENLMNFLKNMIENLFKETNKNKIKIITNYFLSLPLRTVIQILNTKSDLKSLKYILYGNIDMLYTKNLLDTLDGFYINKEDKFFKLYNYIKTSPMDNLNYIFMPEDDSIEKNSLNALLNTHISYSINNIQDICDYVIKFYFPTMNNCHYDYNTHSFKIIRYLNKDLRANSINRKIHKGTIEITNDEYFRLDLTKEEQAVFNIFAVGLFTKNGLKNYFSFWNIFGFISDIFYFSKDINLDKTLQVKSFYLDEIIEKDGSSKSLIQEAEYDTTLLRSLVVLENTKIRIGADDYINIKLSNRQLNSISTRIDYSIKYIDDDPSSTLSEHIKRYIQATLNAFIVVVLENENGIKFNNALSYNSKIYTNNLNILEQNRDKYLWLYSFKELKIWNIINEFSDKLNKVILTYSFKEEFSKIGFEGGLKEIKEKILFNSDLIYKGDVQRIINSIRQRKNIDKSTKNKLEKDLEKIKDKLKVKQKNDNS